MGVGGYVGDTMLLCGVDFSLSEGMGKKMIT